MKWIFLIPCIFALLTTANAEELYKCTDSNGNTIITSTPQDGMKCARRESDEEPKSRNISSKINLIDKCSDLFCESDDISVEITELEKRRSKLQREQLDVRQEEAPSNWNQRRQWEKTKPVNDKMNKVNNELSILYQKKSINNQDIRLYKCNELNIDLSKLNQKKDETNKNKRYKSEVFIRIRNQ
jgi:hypothetical protein